MSYMYNKDSTFSFIKKVEYFVRLYCRPFRTMKRAKRMGIANAIKPTETPMDIPTWPYPTLINEDTNSLRIVGLDGEITRKINCMILSKIILVNCNLSKDTKLERLTNLYILEVINSKITADTFSAITHVYSLILTSLRLPEEIILPDSVGSLHIDDCDYIKVPEIINRNLTILSITRCNLEEIENIAGLKKLNVSSNRITSINIRSDELEELDISNNPITSLDTLHAPNLKVLKVMNTNLSGTLDLIRFPKLHIASIEGTGVDKLLTISRYL